ncbi:glutathione synthetase-like isoform X1 [Chrysoperla carnea]|uniref:glutathione synthetase-like isoform X1 n=1 Tax=Chrysoperla carnea TaxID=189513 RepID=UPI001D08ED66|nr:glutathione synthetase-like isoform X1 [Chrysoperla carnea]
MSTTKLQKKRIATSCITLPLKKEVLEEIVDKAKDWALMHGAAMRSRTKYEHDTLTLAPFILLPSPLPKSEFEKAVAIQPTLNELMHKVAHDYDFLKESLKDTIEVDDFTKNLFDIYEIIHSEGAAQLLSLGLIRSDLMLESVCPNVDDISNLQLDDLEQSDDNHFRTYCCWKQVEINTIASGFGWLGPISAAIQRFVLSELGYYEKLKNLPDNNALSGLCQGMIKAWELYNTKSAVIMFLVEDVTYNICDQRFHEFEIHRLNRDIKVIRRTLTQVANNAKLGPNKQLLIDGCEVAVIYFRAGYEPGHYHSQKEWDARLLMERSLAIKCPSIHYHLAGTKKVQQALARPNTLDKYLKTPEAIASVNEIFTGLYSLDFDEYGERAIKMAMENPERYVLKPQREGGGNNVYGNDIRDVLLKMKDTPERTAWILMDKINPPFTQGYMIRPNNPGLPEIVDLVSELGIFGAIIGNADTILYNKQLGHMLRTKLSTSNEGGVAVGIGALDSPYLIDDMD